MRWRRGRPQPETIVPFEELTPRERRAKIAQAILTASVVATLIVLVYFGFPLTRTLPERSVILFVVSLVLVGMVWIAQILATLQSPYPNLRAMESLGTSVPLYLVTFAATHYLIEYRHAGSYSQPMTRLDALYFATTGIHDGGLRRYHANFRTGQGRDPTADGRKPHPDRLSGPHPSRRGSAPQKPQRTNELSPAVAAARHIRSRPMTTR
jgi:hypothetical protein